MSYPSSPVAYFVFKRPSHTRESFAAIRARKPPRLFIIADGPRNNLLEDVARCHEVREIVNMIDWPCMVYRNYSDTNLGCKRRISSGLDWVFSQVDRAIILEDDCVASPEFFSFCDTLLEFYQENDQVWVVNGNSYQPQHQRGPASYYFSKYPDCWGWATWRRAWNQYQGELPFLGDWIDSAHWNAAFPLPMEQRYWRQSFEKVRRGQIDTWDYQWLACMNYGRGLAATPNANLVKNIGFGKEATHTKGQAEGAFFELTTLGILVHPSEVKPDLQADEWYGNIFFVNPDGLWQRIMRKVVRSAGALRSFLHRCINQ